MSDGYGIKHAVSFSGRHKLKQAAPTFYGLVVDEHSDGTIDVVEVLPVERKTKFYDDVDSDQDPAKDNVLLSSCPPPFSAVCQASELKIGQDGHGQCYAVANLGQLISGPKTRFREVEKSYVVSDEDYALVLNHRRNAKLQKDGSGELRRSSFETDGTGTSRRRFGHKRPKDDVLDVQETDIPVDVRSGTSFQSELSIKAREHARDKAKAEEAMFGEGGDNYVVEQLAKPGMPIVSDDSTRKKKKDDMEFT